MDPGFYRISQGHPPPLSFFNQVLYLRYSTLLPDHVYSSSYPPLNPSCPSYFAWDQENSLSFLSKQTAPSDIFLNLISILHHGCFKPVMESMCLTAFFGFLRCGEFTVPFLPSFSASGIRSCDLFLIKDQHFLLYLRCSKTNQL
ncbi:UNVERIFIED_CONTAM: hypothetical protein FKN15_005454 [Acipenser sinensis]